MSARPLRDAGPESGFDAPAWDNVLGRPLAGRWLGWRSRLLALAVLAGCLGLFLLGRALTTEIALEGQWRADAQGRLVLATATSPWLQAREGSALIGALDAAGRPLPVDTLLLHRSPRWLADGTDRLRHAEMHRRWQAAAQQGPVTLVLADGAPVTVRAAPRGLRGLGATFWLMSAIALLLYVTAMVVVLVQPSERNLLYGLMATAQSMNLLFIAVESLPGLLLEPGVVEGDFVVRSALDLVTAAAAVHATGVHPRRLPRGWVTSALAWACVGTLIAGLASRSLPQAWWWVQLAVVAAGCAAIVQLTRSRRIEPHPAAVVLRRLAVVAVCILALLTVAMAAARHLPDTIYHVAAIGSMVWVVFIASLLALLPFLSRSQQVLREFSMLAGISTVATSLDLLFVAVFSLSQFTSITLALFLSVGVYAGVRQWVLNKMLGSSMITTERAFEQLYRMAREVETRPDRLADRLSQLLREVFEPLEAMVVDRTLVHSRIVGDGSTLLVPVPAITNPHGSQPPQSIVLRYARRGTMIFTADDARLTDRIGEQLRRAVAFDQAVEQGRSEERARLAQDLHDDIGARLLTLMYKAPDAATEEYVRHTLKDLKTLTRGLAASSHPLSHAAAEWKADLTQRLTAAGCELHWSLVLDHDVTLTVVQWSALTRAIRELINNVIAHAGATRVQVDASFSDGQLTIVVADDGSGRNPQAWSHGLGLSGVRKRVRQMHGHVEWRERQPRGIQCRLWIPSLDAAPPSS